MSVKDHHLRRDLIAELHARPTELLRSPVRISYLALVSAPDARPEEWRHLCALLNAYGVATSPQALSHASHDLGPFRVKYERHSEFARYLFIAPLTADRPFIEAALAQVPSDWLSGLVGEVITAMHIEIRKETSLTDDLALAVEAFDGEPLVSAEIGDGMARAMTHYRIEDDGFGRLILFDRGLTPRQCGRMVQRLLEIDTYRMMALLALPIARELAPFLSDCDKELAEVTALLTAATSRDESTLLYRLTRLEASIENRITANEFRFGAARAYTDLVTRRIDELREERITGFATFKEFNDRRLAPAMATCQTVVRQQESLSARVARANELLATRIDVTREEQNQALLASLDRRASIQLRLQQTVEGLSVVAITYYTVNLIGDVAKAIPADVYHLQPDVVMGLSVPLVIMLAALAVRRIRRSVNHDSSDRSA
jgi:uncharacterized membrane-anchored protein